MVDREARIKLAADLIPLIAGLIIFISSLISLRLGVSVAIVEILFGVVAGHYGFYSEPWMVYLAGFGGIILTFLAGAEIDTVLMKEKFRESMLIGTASFLLPFIAIFAYTYWIGGWTLNASLIAGTALSTTSLAVVYSVLVESNLSKTPLGKLIMASTFVTDMGTALALSILFIQPSFYTLIFILVSIVAIVIAGRYSSLLFNSTRFRNKVIEPEIKWIFLVLLVFIYFADFGESHAVLPAFIFGLVMSKSFHNEAKELVKRLRVVAYAIITPFFFIVSGLNVSLPLIVSALGLFLVLFVIKMLSKFTGVYLFAKKYIPNGSMYTTLLMSTGLTFGTISSFFGLQAGYIDQVQFSVLVGVVVASAVIPTFFAQKWFSPVHSEDIINGENNNLHTEDMVVRESEKS
ncbi:MAG: cation:proton antiporter [Candidatus Thorarchaeota archaeon]|nr:cation:proton antiporter [Candidatus Thorarchaeota archaeon]